jgi:hypothetical protein
VLLHGCERVELHADPGAFIVDTHSLSPIDVKGHSRQWLTVAVVLKVVVVELDIPPFAMVFLLEVTVEDPHILESLPKKQAVRPVAAQRTDGFLLSLHLIGRSVG